MSYLQHQAWPGNVRELYNRIERVCILTDSDSIGVMEISADQALLPSATPPQDSCPDLRDYLEHCERDYILRTLEQENGRIGDSAARLGISRKNLWERMRKLGIQSPAQDGDKLT